MRFCLILITALFLAGCSHHKAPPPNARLSDSITVIAGLNDQLQSWHGTPYRYGGMTRRGVDCSGFVVVTMRDRFDLQLPRETKEQASIGTQIDKDELLPGDLVFFKTGSGQNGLHVGIYDTNNQFIHASMMRRAINKGEKRDKCLCCCVTNREKELQKQSEVTRRDEPNYRISFVLAQI